MLPPIRRAAPGIYFPVPTWLTFLLLIGIVFAASLTLRQSFAQGAPAAAPPTAAAPGATAPAVGAPVAAPDAVTPNTDNEDEGDGPAAQTIDVQPHPTAVLTGTATWDNGFKTLMDSFDTIRAGMTKAGLQAGGHPFAVFVKTDDQGFTFNAMIPLVAVPSGMTQVAPNVSIGVSPSGKALKFQHRGAYDDIDSTYEAITAFLDAKDLEAKDYFVEEYLNDIRDSDDESLAVDIYIFVD